MSDVDQRAMLAWQTLAFDRLAAVNQLIDALNSALRDVADAGMTVNQPRIESHPASAGGLSVPSYRILPIKGKIG
jgi:hypothetical protein